MRTSIGEPSYLTSSGASSRVQATVPRDAEALMPVPVYVVPYALAKRALDVLLSGAIVVLGSPVFAAAALLVKLSSPGPILFRQTRVGVGGRLFTCLKFRSMYIDAEARRAELLHLNEVSGPVFKIKDDPRITRVGRVLRKLSLDELPQFFNVLRGDMSLVGPRPPLPDEVRQYTEHQLGRLAVKPGITCFWQISGRSSIGFDQWVELDLKIHPVNVAPDGYRHYLKTIPAVLKARGAH